MPLFDLIVLGGGSAGFAAAIKAAETDKSVALVESGTIGGTCVNVGCVPSKTLIAAANARHAAVHPVFQGLNVAAGRVDFSSVIDEKQSLVETLRLEKYLKVLDAYPQITLVKGQGVISRVDPVVVHVNDQFLEAPTVIVATGARPWIPPVPGLADTPYWTSTQALAAKALPRDLLVVGGSAVGLEIGQMYQRFGCTVTVLEGLDRVAPVEDREVSDSLAAYLTAEGIGVFPKAQITRVSYAERQFSLDAVVDGTARTFTAERLLVATGRRPNSGGFGLDEVGVELDKRGGVVVNEYMQSTVPSVYAAGDVTGQPMFVNVAAEAGSTAATNALGLGERTVDLTALPKVTFTDPQVASVGLTEEQAESAGIFCTCSVLPLKYVPRALASRDTRGLIKLVAEKGTERVIGVHILAPEAGEIVQVGAMAVKHRMTISDLTSSFFPYLTMAEGIKLTAMTFHKDVTKLSCCAGT